MFLASVREEIGAVLCMSCWTRFFDRSYVGGTRFVLSAGAPTFVFYRVAPCKCINNVMKFSYLLPFESFFFHRTLLSEIKSILLTVWAGIA